MGSVIRHMDKKQNSNPAPFQDYEKLMLNYTVLRREHEMAVAMLQGIAKQIMVAYPHAMFEEK